MRKGRTEGGRGECEGVMDEEEEGGWVSVSKYVSTYL